MLDWFGVVSAALSPGKRMECHEYPNNILLGETKGVGGYSEYTLADEQLCFKLPSNLTRTKAVTVPLAACTAWLALFSESCLNIYQTRGSNISVLIWGGSCKAPQKHLL